ncbi:aldo/keto reductase [Methanolapillus ohkumae]|uniref:4Fe-4S ferredoxin-type domain-containing protein n=1 Tax=Methanolapillus ohkumae TaxID=3028298 RepID=A0AA96V736_9EURY|nr:hypothetical protein MsAm2_15760 [Methanosarcinaceae archaeon Am2]
MDQNPDHVCHVCSEILDQNPDHICHVCSEILDQTRVSDQILYRHMEKTGDDLSILGYGCMRFPQKNNKIDVERTKKQILFAIENGINYLDTAYIYSGSETVLGKILAGGYRDRVKLATKMPIPTILSRADMEIVFQTQLERLQTNRIDYYLIHNIIHFEEWERLKQIGILEFIRKKKENKQIINIGFSFHGNLQTFKQIIDDYEWDFCQIQYNYLDENFQAGTAGLEYAASKGLGIVVMEPLRGGTLAEGFAPEIQRILDDFEIKRSPAEWGLRFVWNRPEVSVVLSGMNEEAHILENIRIASNARPNTLTAEELKMISSVKDKIREKIKVECTGCSYCMPCPFGVDIPQCFAYYNNAYMYGGITPKIAYLMGTGGYEMPPSKASLCQECGICETKCPQNIPIRKELKSVAKEMEKWHWRGIVRLLRWKMYRKGGGQNLRNMNR